MIINMLVLVQGVHKFKDDIAANTSLTGYIDIKVSFG
jgi:hypothetical protein